MIVLVSVWIFLVLYYGLAKGLRDGIKKLALNKSSVMEMLFFHTFLSFLMLLPFSMNKSVVNVTADYHFYIIIKAFLIYLAWILASKSIKKMPVSLYGVMDMTRVLFATFWGVVVLNEIIDVKHMVGLTLVIIGLVFVNIGKNKTKNEKREIKTIYLLMIFVSCFLNSISGLMDKLLMRSDKISPTDLQLWYMFYMLVFYSLHILIKRIPIRISTLKNNYWIAVLSLLFVTADRALFVANADANSKIVIMTLIKQSSVLITIIFGKFVYKESNILKRFICAMIIIAGIVIASV